MMSTVSRGWLLFWVERGGEQTSPHQKPHEGKICGGMRCIPRRRVDGDMINARTLLENCQNTSLKFFKSKLICPQNSNMPEPGSSPRVEPESRIPELAPLIGEDYHSLILTSCQVYHPTGFSRVHHLHIAGPSRFSSFLHLNPQSQSVPVCQEGTSGRVWYEGVSNTSCALVLRWIFE